MKTERYIVEIEVPDGDGASPLWLRDALQSDADIEDEGRWKVSVKEPWKPSEEQIRTLEYYMHTLSSNEHKEILFGLMEQLKAL